MVKVTISYEKSLLAIYFLRVRENHIVIEWLKANKVICQKKIN